jgi:hypothetical protein
MSGKQESRWNLEELTAAEISAVIHYLDPNPIRETYGENKRAVFVICFCFLILLLSCAALLWLSCLSIGN